MKRSKNLTVKWEIVKLADLANYINGRAFKPNEWQTEGLPIIRIQNLKNPRAKYNFSRKTFEDKYKVTYGDILFAWSASLGGLHLAWSRSLAKPTYIQSNS